MSAKEYLYNSNFYSRLLGVSIESCVSGYCRLIVPVKEKILNSNGEVYSVVLYFLCSIALNIAAASINEYWDINPCSGFNVSFLHSVKSGNLYIDGRVILNSEKMIITTADIRDESGNNITVCYHKKNCY